MEKIKKLLNEYVQYIKVGSKEYHQIISQLNSYKNNKAQAAPTDPDQPPQKKPDLPEWVKAAEEAEQETLTLN